MTNISDTKQEPNSGYLRLEQQITWYDTKSRNSQRYYKIIKFVEFCFAGFIPFMAHIDANITAGLGVGIFVLEGLQQVNQWSQNWITYRSTCEALRHEKYTYIGRSGVYAGKNDDEAKRILTERTESLISTEHAKWISRQEYETDRIRQVRSNQ
ncbi:MAG: DUF4231 domain-containing protein [Candidatus Yonathbacteria bacterium]|nr:DUF4231 domain-containing protein [Candidatus Yonathbacteria bacterium]